MTHALGASTIKSMENATRDLPVRERILAGLELLGAPAEVRTVAEAAEACTGLYINKRQVSSLRRSERSSWESRPDGRPAYVVPALHCNGFVPLRGYLTSSDWDLSRRLIGPLSQRADYLRISIAVAERLAWARTNAPSTVDRLERLAWRLARSIPGGVREGKVDTDAVFSEAGAELARIRQEDDQLRAEAAERLHELDRETQLFGKAPAVKKSATA